MTKRIYVISVFVLIGAAISFAFFPGFGAPETVYVPALPPAPSEPSSPARLDAPILDAETRASEGGEETANRDEKEQVLNAHQQEQMERQKNYRERQAAKSERMQVYLETVKNETLDESVSKLLLERLSGDFQPYTVGAISNPLDPWGMEYQLKREPRVAKVYDVIENGTYVEREALLHTLHAWVDYLLTGVPIEPHYGHGRVPWIGNLEGALMYPLMLAELDPSERTLDIFRGLYDRVQETSSLMLERVGRTSTGQSRTPLTQSLGLATERIIQSWQDEEYLSAAQSELVQQYEELMLEIESSPIQFSPPDNHQRVLNLIVGER